MAELDTEEKRKKKKTPSSSSMTLDSSSLLPDCVSKSVKMAQPETTEHIPDWSLLPEELLQLISTHLEKEKCFFVDTIHARSVCNSWRSSFPFPSRQLLRQSYSLPAFSKFPRETKELCTLEKIPFFLFRVKTQTPSEYFIGGIARADHHTELLPSPLQCSVKVTLPESDPILMNMLDCQILPLGHHYRIIGWDPQNMRSYFKDLAFLQEGGEGGGFIVLLNYYRFLLVLRSSEMRWIRVEGMSIASCKDLYTFRGKVYAVFFNGDIFVIDPYNSMEAIPLMLPEDLNSSIYLVPSGNEELFLVEKIIPDINDVIDFGRSMCRVSKLDEEAGKWVVVSDLGDQVFFIGLSENFACSGKELPDGCGLSENSILFTYELGDVTFAYKYGVETDNAEDDLSFWRFLRENRVAIRNSSPPVVAFRIERGEQ